MTSAISSATSSIRAISGHRPCGPPWIRWTCSSHHSSSARRENRARSRLTSTTMAISSAPSEALLAMPFTGRAHSAIRTSSRRRCRGETSLPRRCAHSTTNAMPSASGDCPASHHWARSTGKTSRQRTPFAWRCSRQGARSDCRRTQFVLIPTRRSWRTARRTSASPPASTITGKSSATGVQTCSAAASGWRRPMPPPSRCRTMAESAPQAYGSRRRSPIWPPPASTMSARWSGRR